MGDPVTEDLLDDLPAYPLLGSDNLIVGRGGQTYRAKMNKVMGPSSFVKLNPPVSTDFNTWVNQGSTTKEDQENGLYVHNPGTGSSDSLHLAVRNVPAADHFAVTLGVVVPLTSKPDMQAGIALYESGTGKLETFCIAAPTGGGTATENWSSTTSSRSTRRQANNNDRYNACFLKYLCSGNWLQAMISFDGRNFAQWDQPTARRDKFTSGPDEWGPVVNSMNSSTPNLDIGMLCYHFDEDTADNLVPFPSYLNKYGSGNRGSIITVTTNASLNNANPITALVDGVYLSDTGRPVFAADSSGNRQITFAMTAAQLITEAKFYMNSPSSQGTWKWQGSHNGSSYTDISATFTLTGDFDGEIIGDLSANTTKYEYYRMQQTAGSLTTTPNLRSIDFKSMS